MVEQANLKIFIDVLTTLTPIVVVDSDTKEIIFDGLAFEASSHCWPYLSQKVREVKLIENKLYIFM